MWNFVDSNKLVSTESKVVNHQKHLMKVASIKSAVDNKTPWRPGHSLSKRKNKYDRVKMTDIDMQNQSLLNRILKISYGQNNLQNGTPACYTSHDKIYTTTLKAIDKQIKQSRCLVNQKILQKIEGAYSSYGKDIWRPQWKQITSYRNNILKKEVAAADLSVLVRASSAKSRISRPQSAFLTKSRYQ